MPTIKKNTVRLPWEPKPTYQDSKYRTDFYNTQRWRRLSKEVLYNEPFCRECNKKGITTKAKQTDHIIPISKGGLMYDKNNLQPLCISCHSMKTNREKIKL